MVKLNLASLLSILKETPAYSQLLKEITFRSGQQEVVVLDAAKPCLIAALYTELSLPTLAISSSPESSRKLYEQLQVWCPPLVPLQLFPELDALPYERLLVDLATTIERLRTFSLLINTIYSETSFKLPPLIVASAIALASKTIPYSDFVSASHVLKAGTKINISQLLACLEAMGYERESTVMAPGTISQRGGIIDFYPPSSELPVRIELFGNEIESLRLFDPTSQRSVKVVPSIAITPAREMLLSLPRNRERTKQILNSLDISKCHPEMKKQTEEEIMKLLEGQWFPGAEFYLSLFNTDSLLTYLPERALVIMDSPEDCQKTIDELDDRAKALKQEREKRGELPGNFPRPYFTWFELWEKIEKKEPRLMLWSWGNEGKDLQQQLLPFISAPSYAGRLRSFIEEVKERLKAKQRVIVISHQATRLSELFLEEDVIVSPQLGIEKLPLAGTLTLVQGAVAEGWVMPERTTLITDAELFGITKSRRQIKKRPVNYQWFLSEISQGDYVVHVDHGIGKFAGLTRLSLNGVENEYLLLHYAGGDRLYVPVNQVDRLSRYLGGGAPPALSRLGTGEWTRIKQRVKESVDNLAGELLALYAAREVIPGFAFSSDSPWQQELENSFPYLETQDQFEAVQAVKRDMEKLKPMDRLVCGDVGYGKTEVALRAAFKAVMDNKQVAMLVPTTILAQQHFQTFSERLQAFPVRVEMLSRFCSEKEQKTILEGLASGSVDICIGTHRLLQKDVVFKNLGLVIIDEEQRFGVIHKERLKQMRKEVDVLTLSATPIPRTLHMSLVGIKDMSTIETPPEERLPIITYIGVQDDRLIREAILRELERNGQVFFVHNRVQTIHSVACELKKLVPEARIAIAHGQMPEEQLEKVMTEFSCNKSDVLVSTTIIESGLDMPKVNTLIVTDADRLGLTQLYQLRGRVGRGNHRAYAYFFFKKGKRLTPQAQKRLRTIFEATELGAGFRIALKDLEIRGAGNLLGAEQSGHIAAVGFDLYCQLLAEAVARLKSEKGEEIKEKIPTSLSPSIDLPLSAYIPEEYVPDITLRLDLYHRLAKVSQEMEIKDIAQELEDRFGTLPPEVKNLLYIVKLKVLGTGKLESIATEQKQLVLKLTSKEKLKELPLAEEYSGGVKVGLTQIRLDLKRLGEKWPQVLEEILQA